MLTLFMLLEIPRLSKHQEKQEIVRRVLYVLLGIFIARPLTHLHPFKYHIDLAYIDTLEKIVDWGLFVQFQIYMQKAKSPNLSPLFLNGCRRTNSLCDTENN